MLLKCTTYIIYKYLIYDSIFKKSSELTSKVKKLVEDHLGQDLDSIREDTWG